MWTEPSHTLILRALFSMCVVWDQGRVHIFSRYTFLLLICKAYVQDIIDNIINHCDFILCRFWSRTILVWKTEHSSSQCVTWDPRFLSTVLVSSKLTRLRLGTGWNFVLKFSDHFDISQRAGCAHVWVYYASVNYFKSASVFHSLKLSWQYGLLHWGPGWLSCPPWDIRVGSQDGCRRARVWWVGRRCQSSRSSGGDLGKSRTSQRPGLGCICWRAWETGQCLCVVPLTNLVSYFILPKKNTPKRNQHSKKRKNKKNKHFFLFVFHVSILPFYSEKGEFCLLPPLDSGVRFKNIVTSHPTVLCACRVTETKELLCMTSVPSWAVGIKTYELRTESLTLRRFSTCSPRRLQRPFISVIYTTLRYDASN